MPSEKIQVAIDHSNTTFTAPPAIVGGALDDAGDIQNPIAPGGVTDDRQPGFHGQGTRGDTIVIRDNGTEIGTTEVAEDGTWTFTPSTDLLQGLHAITVAALDTNGNESAPSPAFNFEIDVTPPDASRLNVSGFTDNVGGVTGNVISGGTTDETRPLLSGISNGTPGHTVTVMVKDATGTHELGLATIGENGQWTFQVDTPLAPGLNTFMLVERDAAGNETMPTGRYKVTVNTDKPNAPVIDSVFDDVGEPHMLQQGEATNDTRPTLAGTAQANHIVKFYDGSTYLGQAVADENGHWRFTPQADLADGAYNITATSTSPLGQTSNASSAWNFVVDTVPPPTVPTITGVYDDVGASTGNVANGGGTDDTRPTLSGMGEIGAVITVKSGSIVVGTATVGSDGKWSLSPSSDLAFGEHSLIATQADSAGNASTNSSIYALRVGTMAALTEGFETMATGFSFQQGVTLATPSGLLITNVKTGEDYAPYIIKTSHPHLVDGTQSLLVGDGSITRFDFANGGTAAVQYQTRAVHTPGNTAKYYDASGALLGSKVFPVSEPVVVHSFAAPAGKTIAYMIISYPGGDWDNGCTIDSISWQGLVVPDSNTFDTASADAPEQSAFVIPERGEELAPVESVIQSDDLIIAKLGFADRLSGGAGSDTFTHVGTGDTVHGGAGDDTIRINSGDFARLDGGLGIDTLVMDGTAMHIDLSALGAKVQGFEKFDLGAGGNTLALSAQDLLAGGARDMVSADGKVQMLVNGANGDVNLLGGDDGWTLGNAATVGGVTYSVYTNLAGTAELLVEDKVHVTIL